MEFVVVALVLGIIPSVIAGNKGHSYVLWWIFGSLLFIVALPMSIIAKPDEAALVYRGEGRKCPFCAELIKVEAVVCRYCGRDVPPVQAPTVEPPKPLLDPAFDDDVLALGERCDSVDDEEARARLNTLVGQYGLRSVRFETWSAAAQAIVKKRHGA